MRYTEATLLSAMEGAGKLVSDEELRDAMQDKGLGTPATRAAIIENLIEQRYMMREGRELRPTAKAKQLFALISGLGIGALSDPALTGEWEYKLSQIEKGKLTREDFMHEIRDMTTRIVDAAKTYEGSTVPIENPAHLKTRCPKCGGEMYQRDDDKPETIKNRLDVYEKSTAPLIDYYRGCDLLVSIDGDRDVDVVYADVKQALGL